ncbi:hypothetical protein GJ697_19905 [Pseudoduganella sp. FT25W]|uniref:Copper resistance protein n=1 Tax=Duganella alba TaxID=2666081 RepID=A0A6L5QKB5_9BURK|nr:hypothetical protein [Duganella alba]MRX10107.1 hypothetical protein [Duganella alba]MRX16705.1 hypothetical protein [Duganella alba]
MRLTRSHRWFTALIALCSMLFMQLAVSAYACPTQVGGVAQVMEAGHERMSMPDCAGMDEQQPVLCAASAHPGQPSLDKPDLPTVSPFIPSTLSATVIPAMPLVYAGLPPAGDRLLTRATAPPLAIQHCCFRN